MSLDIEETLQVKAPVEKVWKFLIDPQRIVTCLPGAELTKIEDERTFLGNMKVKVGPVTVSYSGRIKLTLVDDAAHRVGMSGEGTEKGGGGSAKMTMESTVVEKDGGSFITVMSKVDLAGKIVQFGRGMVKGVAQQMFKQFGTNLRAALEKADPEPEAVAAPATAPAAGAEPTGEPDKGAATSTEVRAEADRRDMPTRQIAAVQSSPTRPLSVPARKVEPVRIVPIIFKVMWEGIARFFRRLFGGKPA
jgi:carbon monoxide dehydrogenase subunit G